MIYKSEIRAVTTEIDGEQCGSETNETQCPNLVGMHDNEFHPASYVGDSILCQPCAANLSFNAIDDRPKPASDPFAGLTYT